MAKISALPIAAEPTGAETVLVLDAGIAKRADLTKLVAAAVAPQVASAKAARDQAQALVDPINALLSQFGQRYNYARTPSAFTDAASAVDRGTHYEKSPFAKTIFTTTADKVKIHGYATLPVTFPQYAELGVRLDGNYMVSIPITSSGPFQVELTLPGGTSPKTLTIVDGLRSKDGNLVRGTYFTSIEANAPVPQLLPAPVNRTVFIGDSIMAGANATIPTKESYIARLRNVAGGDSIVALGYGFNTFAETCGNTFNSVVRDANVAQLVGLGPANVVNALGTNDWALLTFSTANLTAAYALWLDAVHAALPAARIFVVSPIIRGSEDAQNAHGYTIQQFRDAIAAACVGCAWVTYVDGKAFLTVNDLADGVHPTSSGMLKWAQGIDGYLGYTVPDAPVSVLPLNAGPDAYGAVTNPSPGVSRYTKNSGGNAFNAGGFGGLRDGDLLYQIDVTGYFDLFIGFGPTPHQNSGFGDTLHALYMTGGGGLISYDGGVQGAPPAFTDWTPVDPSLSRFFLRRVGSTVTILQGATLETARTLLTYVGIVGAIGADYCIFQQGGTFDVRQIV